MLTTTWLSEGRRLLLAATVLTVVAALLTLPTTGVDAAEPGEVSSYGLWSDVEGRDGPADPIPCGVDYSQTAVLGALNTVRFGCPAETDKSGFGFDGVLGGPVVAGTYFEVGRLIHYNNPIWSGNNVGTADLDVTVQFSLADSTVVQHFDVTLDETPNEAVPCQYPDGPNQGGCSDRIDITTPAPQVVTVDGVTFTVELLGFTELSGGTCTTANPKTFFLTAEGAATTSCLMGRFGSGSLTIVKNTTNADGTFRVHRHGG